MLRIRGQTEVLAGIRASRLERIKYAGWHVWLNKHSVIYMHRSNSRNVLVLGM